MIYSKRLHQLRREDGSSCSIQVDSSSEDVSILAFSVATRDREFTRVKEAAFAGRKLLSDRKSLFSHLTPKQLVSSTIRVAAVQASNMLANYLTDQIQEEAARDDLVREGKLTADEADVLNAAWEEREWNRRQEALPMKIYNGILKFHAITLVMRFYESVAARICDDITLDRLTMDPFRVGKLLSEKVEDKREVSRRMYDTCLWSNVIAFLADYSVHQVILVYGYYVYYRAKRSRQKQKGDSSAVIDGPMYLSFLMKSTRLAFSRLMGLYAAAFGGAWGSRFYPGWGTLLGSQLGDGMTGTFFDTIFDTIPMLAD